MSAPKRVQLRRTKGYRKPEGAVVVARPSKWGNPFYTVRQECEMGGFCWTVHDPTGLVWEKHLDAERHAREVAVDLFEIHTGPMGNYEYEDDTLVAIRRELAGRDLCCWCPEDQPCHADVLLRLANEADR